MTRKQIRALQRAVANLKKDAALINDVMFPSCFWDKIVSFATKNKDDADLNYKDFDLLRDAHDSITYACDVIERVINKQK